MFYDALKKHIVEREVIMWMLVHLTLLFAAFGIATRASGCPTYVFAGLVAFCWGVQFCICDYPNNYVRSAIATTVTVGFSDVISILMSDYVGHLLSDPSFFFLLKLVGVFGSIGGASWFFGKLISIPFVSVVYALSKRQRAIEH